MNNPHYSEADLLETYYTRPGASMPVMMHLAECPPCAARYERLESKLRGIAACDTGQPDTFWARQRHTVMRSIARKKQNHPGSTLRVAAAAALAFLLGGFVFYQRQPVPSPAAPAVTTLTAAAATPVTTDSATVPEDPWQSDELNDYEPMVAWETWVEPAELAKSGGRS
ncbi:MAG TPA: hypothetical protein VGF48_16660 [Thermoanaerobaculia bacterium]